MGNRLCIVMMVVLLMAGLGVGGGMGGAPDDGGSDAAEGEVSAGRTSAPGPRWMPGDPFDKYAEVKINFLKNVKTGQTLPPTAMPPDSEQAVNVSVVIKPGVTEDINIAVLNVSVWYAADPKKTVYGEYYMTKFGPKEAKKEIPNLLQCTKVYWTVKVWDSANRMIQSNNSVAASTIQNYTVKGACNWPDQAEFRNEINITQDPYSASDWRPLPPSEISPGPNMSAMTQVTVTIRSVKYIQMPWVIMYFNQSTYDGKENRSYTTAVRGMCRDAQYSPNACDVSNTDPKKKNGTAYEFYVPGFLAGFNIEYSFVAVDYRIYDYTQDPAYKANPWDYILNRKYCEKVPESCLASPNYYYYIPQRPPPPKRYAGSIVVQLLKKEISVSGEEQLFYISDGCVQFSNDTIDPRTGKPWKSSRIPADEWGVAVSPPFVVNVSANFTIKAWAPCDSQNMQVARLTIPNSDGPNGTVKNLVIIVFSVSQDVNYPFTPVGWPGENYAIVYTVGLFGFFAPVMFLALRFFRGREEAERRKRQDAEQRFKI